MIEIVHAAALASVQDHGRFGHYKDGLGQAGAMDRVALALGNALLGNQTDAAAIEVPMFPFSVRFEEPLSIAVTGADCAPELDGMLLPPDWAFDVQPGQTLRLGPTKSGCRAYLCVSGGIDVPLVLGSRSTQLREEFGGFEGRTLRSGDRLRATGSLAGLPENGLGAMTPSLTLPLGSPSVITVRVLPAAEYGRFTPEARTSFWQSGWKVTNQSNRAGYRLEGPPLELEDAPELRSHGVVPGVIQVPRGGQPIIQMADAATMGGYPKIGAVIEADLWRLGQARPGDLLQFMETEYETAVAAAAGVEAFLEGVGAQARRQRAASRGWRP